MKGSKLFALALLSMASVLVFASLMIVWSTSGRGAVRNREGRTAHFYVEASKTHHRDSVRVRGVFQLEFPAVSTNTSGDRLRIEAHEYSQEGNTSVILGPATFRRVTASGVHEFVGRGRVRFVSRRHSDEVGDPDILEATFWVPEGNFQFGFGGHVVAGDVTVAKTESY